MRFFAQGRTAPECFAGKGPGDSHSLLLPADEHGGALAGVYVLEANRRQKLLGSGDSLAHGHPYYPHGVGHIFKYCQVGEQIEGLVYYGNILPSVRNII